MSSRLERGEQAHNPAQTQRFTDSEGELLTPDTSIFEHRIDTVNPQRKLAEVQKQREQSMLTLIEHIKSRQEDLGPFCVSLGRGKQQILVFRQPQIEDVDPWAYNYVVLNRAGFYKLQFDSFRFNGFPKVDEAELEAKLLEIDSHEINKYWIYRIPVLLFHNGLKDHLKRIQIPILCSFNIQVDRDKSNNMPIIRIMDYSLDREYRTDTRNGMQIIHLNQDEGLAAVYERITFRESQLLEVQSAVELLIEETTQINTLSHTIAPSDKQKNSTKQK